MNLKTKVTIGALLFATLPILIASSLIGWIAVDSSKNALYELATQKVISIRDTKKAQIEDHFKNVRSQIAFLSDSQMVIDALMALNDAFINFRGEFDEHDLNFYRTGLSAYYQSELATEFAQKNAGMAFDWRQALKGLDEDGITIQYQYLKNNPHAIGSKGDWSEPEDDTLYSQIHSLYHSQLKSFRDRFGYLDILLVEPETQRVIYSVSKQTDFAASVSAGPLENSGIGRVVKSLQSAKNGEPITIEDFSFYGPAFNNQVAFVASPVFDDEDLLGYLVFEIGSRDIDDVMTTGLKWREAGLGETGESYLVAQDLKARSISREFVEHTETYLQRIGAEQNSELAKLIAAKRSNVGLEVIDTQGSRSAVAGETGLTIFDGIQGRQVISAYTPLAIEGLNWAILSEIETDEAFSSAESLASVVTASAGTILLTVLVLAALLGWYLGRLAVKPIIGLEEFLSKVEANADLTLASNLAGKKDEVGRMAGALDRMLARFRDSIQGVASASMHIAESANQLSGVADTSEQGIQIEQENIGQVAAAVTQMAATVKEVARNASSTAEAARQAETAAGDGRDVVSRAIASIEQVARQVKEGGGVIKKLEQNSQDIGSVLDVIQGIAEQTNLLALNAAIEAARAGEQGRGFAVVADEVRSLANRTHEATKEIETMIQSLQMGSKQAVEVMDRGIEHTHATVDQAEEVGVTLNSIASAIDTINVMSQQIATATEQQIVVAGDLDRNVVRITEQAEQTLENAGSISQSSDGLVASTTQLDQLVARFKV